MRTKPYVVGYGKPPQRTRFKPGQSGNPLGRPTGAKNLKTWVNQALESSVTVTVNGRRVETIKGQAIINRLVDRALEDDHKAAQLVLGMRQESETRDGVDPANASLTEADRQALQFLLKHRSRRK
jgi:Family of unknown function (DUF5681)